MAIDYYKEILDTIIRVQASPETRGVKLNSSQLEYLKRKLGETQHFLRATEKTLIFINDEDDIRRKALLRLHFAVVRAARIVHGCCCERESWLQSAFTLAQIKEDIIDIVLDLRWWRSMVHIAIASVTWVPNGDSTEANLMQCAEEDFQKLLKSFQSSDNELEKAASKDMKELLEKLQEVETLYAGGTLTPKQKQEYLLAVHVKSRLQNLVEMDVPDLNTYVDGKARGSGTFGAVMDVEWLGRRCALKVLTSACMKEATCLSAFQHPHIVQFYHYWEDSATIADFPDNLSSGPAKKSHILMELMDMDLNTWLGSDRAEPRVGSKRRNESPVAMPNAENVGLDVMIQVAKAMCQLNSKEVVHRDLKPHNVLINLVRGEDLADLSAWGYLRAKLADFGLAKTKAMSSALELQTAYVGTKVYAAPEVFLRDAISDRRFPRRADVWSFGVTMNEVFTRKAPFPQLGDALPLKKLHAKIRGGLRPALPPNCPTYLKIIIESCWQLRPQSRPSFPDLWRMLRVAQVRSLGIIKRDHNLFTFPLRSPPPEPHLLPRRCYPSTVPVAMWLNRWFDYMGSNLFGRPPRISPLSNWGRIFSKRNEASSLNFRTQCKPLDYFVNQVYPDSEVSRDSKLDVIFFEGNAGPIDFSCEYTWVKRGKPCVWWPQQWLPRDLNGDIRVLLLKYSISKSGIEQILQQLLTVFVFSENWNRERAWKHPIVLVGHSLGCIIIEHLILALDKKVRSSKESDDIAEVDRTNVAKSFLASLAGCFFYAPPWRGLVPSENLLKHVFGAVTYSNELFTPLFLDSPEVTSLSNEFMTAITERYNHVKLMALLEGLQTLNSIVVPPSSVADLKKSGTVKVLNDCCHTDICKPINQQHESYTSFLGFVRGIMENHKVTEIQ